MKKISAWAKANPWPARIIIFLLHFILIASAVYIGKSLAAISISISPSLNLLAILLYIAAFLIYPPKQVKWSGRWISRYAYQKSCDFILTFTGLFMICFLVNRPANELIQQNPLKGAYPNTHNEQPTRVSNNSIEKKSLLNVLSRKERKALLKELRVELRKAFKAKPTELGRIALIALVAAVSIFLLTLVAALSCELSCSGNEGAAILVLLLGAGAVLALMVILIRKINVRYEKRRSRHDTWEPR